MKAETGFGLVEVMIGLVVAGLLIAGLSDALFGGLQARAATALSDDAVAQGNFALSRISTAIRNATPPAAPSALAAAQANTTGAWLAPYSYTFTPTTGVLTETNGSTTVAVADHVTAFSATPHVTSPASHAVFPHPLIDISLTLDGGGTTPVTLATSVRIGGAVTP